jgi:hypothetical protein
VLCLGFTGLQDFDTAVPESSLTVQKVEKEMHVLHLLGVSAAKIKPAAGKQTQTSKKQLKDKTKIAKALSAAVGLTLQAKRASGGKRRRSQGAASGYVLAVAKPVQEIMDQPSELVAEHWYRRKYKQEPPHLDGLYTGEAPLTDELRAALKEQQEADDECQKLEEQKKEAADFAERILKEQQQASATSDARPTGIWPVITEQQRQEQQARSLEQWNQIVSKAPDTGSMTE